MRITKGCNSDLLLNIFCCCRVGNGQFRDRSPRLCK
nr:MAG TPA: hypothetical protein [Caudoviricetes sp.]